MKVLPTNFETRLTSTTNNVQRVEATWLFELYLAAGTLFFSSRAITWDSQVYTRLVTKCSPIIETMGARVPACTVTFSNLGSTLLSHLDPVDLITGKRMIIREVVRDPSSGNWETGSVVMMNGFMEAPERWDQKSLSIRVTRIDSGATAMTPSRATTNLCNVHQFKEAGQCGYAGGETSCDRTYTDCTTYARTHEFQGFRGRRNPRLVAIYDFMLPPGNKWVLGPPDFWSNWPGTVGESASLSDYSRYIPVVLGRRLLSLTESLIEETTFIYTDDLTGRSFTARFYALGEGELSDLKNWYADQEDVGDEVVGVDPIGKTFGAYWRPGTIGLDDTETEAEYLADPNTLKRAQNRDWMSVAADPYSHTGYLILIQEATEVNSVDQLQSPFADVEGLKIQKYTDADTPTTDGSPAFTTNPIWEATALYLDRKAGAGRWLTTADFRFPIIEPAADVCDNLQSGPNCLVKASDTSTTYTVDSTQDFQRGMIVQVDNGVPENSVCVEVISDTEIELEDAIEVTADLGVLTARLPRYSCNLVLDRPQKVSEAIGEVLAHCFGYVTMDAEGRIELRVETSGSSVAHFKDTGYDTGYGIIADSFEILSAAGRRYKSTTNRVFATFVGQSNDSDEVNASDYDHIASYGVVAEKIDFDGCDNAHTGKQLATTHLNLRRDLGNGARFKVGPIGCKIQPGDLITITHAVPNWTDEVKRVTRVERNGLGSKDDLLTRITVEHYESTSYADIDGEQRLTADITYPTVTLSIDSVANGDINLVWDVVGGDAPILGWGLFKSNATHAGNPSLSDRIATFRVFTPLGSGQQMQRRFTYSVLDSEYTESLYFVVRANLPPHAAVVSNEVIAAPADSDPSDVGGSPFNMLYGGDFNDIYDWTYDEGTGTPISPNAQAAVVGFDQGITDDAANTIDDNTSTKGYVSLDGSNGAIDDYGHKYTFASTTKTGKIRVIMGASATASPALATLQARYRIDGVDQGYWVYEQLAVGTGSDSSFPKTTFESGTLTLDLADLEVRTQGFASGVFTGPTQVDVFEVYFVDMTTRPYSSIGNSQATVIGDGSDYGEVSRPFPGRDPTAGEVVFADGSKATAIAWFKRADDATACTQDLEILIRDNSVSPVDEWAILTIAGADVTDSWQAVWQYTLFDEEVAGDLEWVARTKDAAGMLIDTCGVFRGEKAWNYSPNRAEPSSEGNQTSLREADAPRGPWSGTGDQRFGS